MAYRLIPGIDPSALGDLIAGRRKGDKDHWEKATWFKTKLSATELFGGEEPRLDQQPQKFRPQGRMTGKGRRYPSAGIFLGLRPR